MNKQRFAVIIVAIIGMIATFLPWYEIEPSGIFSGIASSGWFTFIMFGIVLLLALRKNTKEDMTMGISWCAAIIGLLASFVVLWRIIDVFFAKEGMFSPGGDMAGVLGSHVTVGYGAWLEVVAGLAVPVVAFLFRDRTFRRV